jgi:hypothetical protein
MTLNNLAWSIGAAILTNETKAASVEVDTVCAGDRISDLLNGASNATLVVTNLSNAALVHAAELVDVPGICLLNGDVPDPDMLKAASQHGTVLILSPVGMFETCGRLYRSLAEECKTG